MLYCPSSLTCLVIFMRASRPRQILVRCVGSFLAWSEGGQSLLRDGDNGTHLAGLLLTTLRLVLII